MGLTGLLLAVIGTELNENRDTAMSEEKSNLLGQLGIAPYVERVGQEYMDDQQLAHFRNILETWHEHILKELKGHKNRMIDKAHSFPEPNVVVTQEEKEYRQGQHELKKNIMKRLNSVKENEGFGYCSSCGIEIGIRRLEADILTGLCINCNPGV